jgi:hypothetical protein
MERKIKSGSGGGHQKRLEDVAVRLGQTAVGWDREDFWSDGEKNEPDAANRLRELAQKAREAADGN